MDDGQKEPESGTKKMKNRINVHTLLIALLVITILGVVVSGSVGYKNYADKEAMKQELNLDGLFVNIKGVSTKTINSDSSSAKPYDTIVIKIPSIASSGDDATAEKDVKNINQIIDREKLDIGFTKWLKSVFDKKVVGNYTDHIEVWYRDAKIINENYNPVKQKTILSKD